MITQEDRLLFKKKIISSRALLMRNYPFFALLLMHMRYVAVPGMEQISTNGETIFFSPDMMRRYSQNELCSLLCHQVMHILAGDIWRPLSLKGDEFHYERDLVVNAELKTCGVSTNYVYLRSLPEAEDDCRFFSDKPAPRRMADSDEFWSYELYDIEDGAVILDTAENIQAQLGSSEAGQHLRSKGAWKRLARQYSGNDIHNIPMSIKRSCMGTGSGRLDWRKLLADFIQEETFDYSFCPPDKRSDDIGFFLPDYNEKEFVVRDVLFMVDTSGSISEEDLNEAYAEIQHAIDLFNGKLTGWLGFFDADITEPLPFTSAREVAKIIPYGGGGTDFCPIFDYLAHHHSENLPACLIIYTDGFGSFPSQGSALGVPVLWLINNDEVTPPFGTVARVRRKSHECE